MIRGVLLLLVVFSLLVSLPPEESSAQSISQIKDRIEEINRERAKIDEEIAGYQKQLNEIAGEKHTLQSAIQTLDVSRSKTTAQIRDIESKIRGANLRLQELDFEITDKEALIALDQAAVAEALRAIHKADEVSIFERLFSSENFTDAWTSVDQLASLNQSLHAHANALSEAKVVLREQQSSVSSTKNQLASHNVELQSQKQALDINRQGKQELLTQTQSEEAAYQALIAERRKQQAAFDALLFQFEAQLKQALDPSSIPSAGSGTLLYPLDSIYVTQYFGKTVDAKRLYVSGSHGGVDFRASIGTPVKAALSGTVTEIESTNIRSGCQYGKFVLVKHANGLSTIYAHLSSVNVSKGSTVTTGEVIGYSGNTGYSTGPHLHFGVYASEGIKVVTADQLGSTYCAGIKTVAANPEAYLDTMLYI